MKKIFKKNQIIITSLAIMIVIAGYLNFTAEKTLTTGTGVEASKEDKVVPVNETGELLESVAASEFAAEEMTAEDNLIDVAVAPDEDLSMLETEESTTLDGKNVGEAVLTSTPAAASFSAAAKLNREQTRSKNKETLMEMINNEHIAEELKQEAMDNLMTMTDKSEKELAAETLLESKGFVNSVVSITDESVDVVVGVAALNDAQRAQVEDIVTRKTEMDVDHIVITTLND